MTLVGVKPRRKLKQAAAKRAPTSSSASSTSSAASGAEAGQPRLLRAQSELDLTQPPRYSTLFPPEGVSPIDYRRSNPPLAVSTTNLRAPHSNLPARETLCQGSQNAFSRLDVSRIDTNPYQATSHGSPQSQDASVDQLAHGVLCDLISSKFDSVITSIDGEEFNGDEKELEIHEGPNLGIRGGWGSTGREVSRGANRAISSAVISTNYFAKANLHANSKLPPNLPPLKL